jgi:predicted metal-dependent phosphoesterase TrpH
VTLIDLHLHTTASDGHCTPSRLVDRAAAAGVTVMAVTDHDTTAAVEEVRAHAAGRGIQAIGGIEITAVEDGRDVHMLGYFIDPGHAELNDFLARQRGARVERIEKIGARLAELGMPVNLQPLLREARRQTGRSIGRPKVAQAMIAAGYVANTQEAFDRWLARGLPAFVPRSGPTCAEVVEIVHHAGGLASLAHPGRTKIDARIVPLRDAGLDAIEVYHSDHDAVMVERYRRLAGELGLLTTGGSDFHGDPAHGFEPGTATLPADEWERLEAARHRHAAR